MSGSAPVASLRELASQLELLCNGRLLLKVADGLVSFRQDGEESPSEVLGFGEIIDDGPLDDSLPAAAYSLLDSVQSSMMKMVHGPWPVRDGRSALTVNVEMGTDSTILAGFCDSSDWVWVVSLSTAGDWHD